MDPEKVEQLVGVPAESLYKIGQPIKPGVTSLVKRSATKFELDFPTSTLMFEMVPARLHALGGPEHLLRVKELVEPEFVDVGLVLNVRNSEEQEDGFIETETMADLTRLGATLAFGFP